MLGLLSCGSYRDRAKRNLLHLLAYSGSPPCDCHSVPCPHVSPCHFLNLCPPQTTPTGMSILPWQPKHRSWANFVPLTHSLCLWDHLWHWYREWLWEGTHIGLSFLAGSRMCSPHEAPLINSPGCTIDGSIEGRFLSLSPYVGQHGTGAACRTQRLRPALCLPSALEHWCKTQLK